MRQALIRRHLKKQEVEPEDCTTFRMVSHGPLFPEVRGWNEHKEARDEVAALEKALADALRDSGAYNVLNTVNCRIPLDPGLWDNVRDAFAEHFPELSR